MGIFINIEFLACTQVIQFRKRGVFSIKLHTDVGQTKFTVYCHSFRFCMWVGGHYSHFKLVEKARLLCSTSRSPRPRLLIRALEGVESKLLYIYCIVSEI